MKTEIELGLRIDAKYYRLCIHRATLKAIGNPEFVSLGIHPESGKLVILAAAADEKDVIRVQYSDENTFCVHSKVLLDGIRTVAPQIRAQDSCLLHGKLLKEPCAVAFDMNNIETMSETK